MGSDNFLFSWEEAVNWLKGQADRKDLVKAAFYDDPLIDAAKRYAESSEWIAVRELLSKESKGRALDIGAGRGISSYALAKDGWTVTALEPDPSAVVGAGAIRGLAKDAHIDLDIVEEWGEDLPFPDNSFNLVYCRAVLHHANNLDDLCNDVYRVLKPNGVFIATREHVLSRKEDLDVFLHSHPLHHLYGGEHAYLLNEYLGAIKNSGFKIERILNPAASDVNLYPQAMQELKDRIASRLHLPVFLVPNWFLRLRAAFSNEPG
ncbi:MAG: methyltransferase domain-containing protein, partial [Gammaproteobacteria bacterium]|nr:methyltransferase domain-containing protein [Gammaproteobacteria bacterium]